MGSKDKEVLGLMYKALIRPHLKYFVQFWPAVFKKINLNWNWFREGPIRWLREREAWACLE